MELNAAALDNKAFWQNAAVKLPGFEHKAMVAETRNRPTWVHFGAGNIFRGFIANLQQSLLNQGLVSGGIIAADTFDYDIIDKIYAPHDCMSLLVSLKPDGSTEREIVSSIALGVKAGCGQDMAELEKAFLSPSLQLASFTITEKGYALRDLQGNLFPVVENDFAKGPSEARHAMSIVVMLMLKRYQAGAFPMALVSMDNCSHNGEKLRCSIVEVAQAWVKNGFAPEAFLRYLTDEAQVSFPWSMIDKITPRPDAQVAASLAADGVEGMDPIVTSRNTYIASFVNAEVPQYLVIEDRFPNGRPPLEKAGVYMTDRETVNKTERMKVTTCLNPLHTALAVYGCLLGYTSIAAEMKDTDLKALVEHIGYDEGMPVVVDPGILSPKAFIAEVIDKRLPNPFIPDTPQRIATDTSQKVAIRFGETIKAYLASDKLDVNTLTCIPLAIAGWLRYLLAVDDLGNAITLSSDPMLSSLQAQLAGITLGKPSTCTVQLTNLLQNEVLFGVDLVKAGLADKITQMFREMLAGKGAVRSTLQKYL
ncbi:MAG: mannitol dehydrogenase family protein [Eubacteriales bacterium]|nr:mannitol dehydrogenase family protein [Eubacteriales bacterium]